MSELNRQALFANKPILKYYYFDPKIPEKLFHFNNYDIIYTDESTYGSLITRIRVISTGLIDDIVTQKVIYLGIKIGEDTDKTEVLYKSAVMAGNAVGLKHSDVLPYVEFTFGYGLVTKPGDKIIIGASTNENTTTERGDGISVILEGGIYDSYL